MTDTASVTAPKADAGFRRVSVVEPAFGRIQDFLTDEAGLLDDDRYHDWLALMTDDVTYKMPSRKTVYRRDGRGFDDGAMHFDDDKMTLSIRVRRSMDIPSAFDRDPAPRMRRLVTNVTVHETEIPTEYAVSSALLLLRNRLAATTYDLLSAQRKDILRETDDGFRLARRLILIDQAALGNTFLNVFV